MKAFKTIATVFGIVHLLVGISSLAAPLVKGSPDRVINRHSGLLFGVAAVNPPHSILHVLMGAMGLLAGLLRQTQAGMARAYLSLNALMFGAMAAFGWARYGGDRGIHSMMGLSVNRGDHVIHTVWSLAAAVAAILPRAAQQKVVDLSHAVPYEPIQM